MGLDLTTPTSFNIIVTISLLLVTIATIVKVLQIDKSDHEKRIGSVSGMLIAIGIILAFVVNNHFSDNPEGGIQFVTAIVLLLFLPATLMALGTLTIVLSNAPAPF